MTTKKKYISILITIICLGVFIYAAMALVGIFMDYYDNRKVLANVQESYYNEAETNENDAMEDDTSSNENGPPAIQNEFQELYKQNDETVGWITIEDTEIDYPILQSNNNEDYLNQNFYKEYSIAGSIFMDYRNGIDQLNPNTIIYGHRMNDGSMFDDLIHYKDKEFYSNHPTIEFNTLYASYEAEIFAAYITTTDFNYIKTDFNSDEEYNQFLTSIQEQSIYQTDVEVSIEDQILTLSTCDYVLDPNEGRMVVHAKLVEKNK